jgi:hypothetical protein
MILCIVHSKGKVKTKRMSSWMLYWMLIQLHILSWHLKQRNKTILELNIVLDAELASHPAWHKQTKNNVELVVVLNVEPSSHSVSTFKKDKKRISDWILLVLNVVQASHSCYRNSKRDKYRAGCGFEWQAGFIN